VIAHHAPFRSSTAGSMGFETLKHTVDGLDWDDGFHEYFGRRESSHSIACVVVP